MDSLKGTTAPAKPDAVVTCSPQLAWAIHIFTSTGIVATFLGLLSVLDGSPRAAIAWLTVAMVIDGLDGPIARRYRISHAIPHIDGNALDLMIDYSACVVAPAVFLHRFDMLPSHDNISLICIGLVLVSSLYLMSNKDIMTSDNYFNGFPAMWNIVITCLFALQSPKTMNVIVVLTLVLFTLVPLKFIHPIRVRDFRRITVPILVVWLAAQLYVTWILDDRTQGCVERCLPNTARVAQAVIYLGAAWIVGVGLWRTVRGRPTGSDDPHDSRDESGHSGVASSPLDEANLG